jgi:phage tail sheath protein FI
MVAQSSFTPGVFINEVALSGPPIVGVGTSTAGFVGKAPKAGLPKDQKAQYVTSPDQFASLYIKDATQSTDLSRAVQGFFANGGTACYVVNTDSVAPADIVAGLKLIEVLTDVEILAAPGQTDATVWKALQDQATLLRDRFAILDPPSTGKVDSSTLAPGGANRPNDSMYSAFYYPRLLVGPQLSGDPAQLTAVTPVGHVAGVYARVDGSRGVHKAPANEVVLGAVGLEDLLTDNSQSNLNNNGVNVIRNFTAGATIWGARTLLASTADPTFRYVNVRRFATYVEQSLKVGLRPYVFEPNILPLRARITRSVRAFLTEAWNDGALFGASADEAFYVRFPDAFNTDDDRAKGILTIEIGLRVAYPAEFIIVNIGLLLQSAASA